MPGNLTIINTFGRDIQHSLPNTLQNTSKQCYTRVWPAFCGRLSTLPKLTVLGSLLLHRQPWHAYQSRQEPIGSTPLLFSGVHFVVLEQLPDQPEHRHDEDQSSRVVETLPVGKHLRGDTSNFASVFCACSSTEQNVHVARFLTIANGTDLC